MLTAKVIPFVDYSTKGSTTEGCSSPLCGGESEPVNSSRSVGMSGDRCCVSGFEATVGWRVSGVGIEDRVGFFVWAPGFGLGGCGSIIDLNGIRHRDRGCGEGMVVLSARRDYPFRCPM